MSSKLATPEDMALATSAESPRVAGRTAALTPAAAALKLFEYCRSNEWAGYDPYDALNSGIFRAVPALDRWLPRLVLTQVLKRSPLNVRPLLLVPKTQNPKGLALFLGSMLTLSKASLLHDTALIDLMIERIVALRSEGTPHFCWGYSFPWQTRTKIVPRGAPNVVCTTFVASALVDAYEARGDARLLEMARSAAQYMVERCYREDESSRAYFLYPFPDPPQQIHNANFLAAAFLCRVAKHTGDRSLIDPAMKAARYSASRQRGDGSWMYGESPKQQWIDNFHTGYNLSGLRAIAECTGTREFESAIRRGFTFYRDHFFTSEGAPRYFHDHTYPVDAHCVSQSLLSLLEFKHLDPGNLVLARKVYSWAMRHMWNDQGYFYYRVLRFATIRTPYMRWTQAWMLLALATVAADSEF
jgi:rhamnogalacturonyl hydrolase YesR